MKFILGKKVKMTQDFREKGEVVPLTVIEAGPCLITQIKTKEKDGYQAVQVGFGFKKKLTKPLRGHLKNLGNFKYLKEFRLRDDEDISLFKVGLEIKVDLFSPGDKVQVTGTSKGKGFAGVVKRHGFHGSPASHGHKDQLRMPGSIGATDPARVFKGTRMAGRMGGQRVTIKNLEVFKIDKENNLLYLKGAVPGARGSLVLIKGEGEFKLEEEKPKEEKPKEEKQEEKQDKEKQEEEAKEKKVEKEETMKTSEQNSQKEKEEK